MVPLSLMGSSCTPLPPTESRCLLRGGKLTNCGHDRIVTPLDSLDHLCELFIVGVDLCWPLYSIHGTMVSVDNDKKRQLWSLVNLVLARQVCDFESVPSYLWESETPLRPLGLDPLGMARLGEFSGSACMSDCLLKVLAMSLSRGVISLFGNSTRSWCRHMIGVSR